MAWCVHKVRSSAALYLLSNVKHFTPAIIISINCWCATKKEIIISERTASFCHIFIVFQRYPVAFCRVIEHDVICASDYITYILVKGIDFEHLSPASGPLAGAWKSGTCWRASRAIRPTTVVVKNAVPTGEPVTTIVWVVESNEVSHFHGTRSFFAIDLKRFSITVAPVISSHEPFWATVAITVWVSWISWTAQPPVSCMWLQSYCISTVDI